MKKDKICCLCGKPLEKKYTPAGRLYWDEGNNAQPVKDGRCCDVCNMTKVIPARFAELRT